jgi:hypothetical protein
MSDRFRSRAELRRQSRVIEGRRAAKGVPNRFSSRSRPALPAEILGGFSSSLLPPSFLRGRSATFFFGARAGAARPSPPQRDPAAGSRS